MKKYKYTYELCPLCENQVMIEAKFERQVCPECKNIILPCSICTFNEDYSKCSQCPLDKED